MDDQQDNKLETPASQDGSKRELVLPTWKIKLLLGAIYLFMFTVSLFVADHLFYSLPILQSFFISFPFWVYFGLSIILFCVVLVRCIRHKYIVHKGRLGDCSEIEALMIRVETLVSQSTNPDKPLNCEKKIKDIQHEVRRLKEIGPMQWTEYQILALRQLLVDFYKVEDLKTEAEAILAELEEYSEDSSYAYDKKLYENWKERIHKSIEKIDDKKNETGDINNQEEPLRAELRTLLGHVTDYEMKWAQGSAVIRGLVTCVAIAIPILLVMALAPTLHPEKSHMLGILNWGLLGICGSLTAVLLSLRKSDLVEVGNTEGKKELWRAILGAPLGLVAGILTYGIIAGGLLDGTAVPYISGQHQDIQNIGLSIVWGLGSGFYFEGVFERMRSATEGKT